MTNFIIHTKRGFTLLETLVAVTILIIGVLGPLSLASRGISDGLFAQNQLTATFLAEEALEIFKSIRDGNLLNGRSAFSTLDTYKGAKQVWVNGLTGVIGTGCGVEDTKHIDSCVLIYNTTAKAYVPAENNETGNFSRKIEITSTDFAPVDNKDDQLEIKVTIYWQNKTMEREFSLVGYVYAQ